MKICRGCGGVLGIDCWNEMDCISITNSEENRYRANAEHASVISNENAYAIHLLEHRVNALENKVAYLTNLIHEQFGIVISDNTNEIDNLPF